MNALLARLRRIFWIRFTLDVFTRFGKDNGGLLAAGLAFFMVLAFVPLLLVGLWALGHIYASKPDEAVQKIYGLLQTQVLPGAAGDEVRHLMERAQIATESPEKSLHAGATLLNILHKRGFAGIVGVLGLVWAALQIFINGSTAMNAAWETTEKRGWVALRLIALGLLVAVGVLIVLSLAATAASTAISASTFAHEVPFSGAALSLLTELGAVLVSALMYAVVYKFLPSAQVTWKAAFVGGFAASVAWEVAKKGLSVYLLKANHSLYGDLANLIVFILWVLYSMTILLLGAETSATYAAEVEKKSAAQWKRASLATPAADASAGNPALLRAKERNRAQRARQAQEPRKPGRRP